MTPKSPRSDQLFLSWIATILTHLIPAHELSNECLCILLVLYSCLGHFLSTPTFSGIFDRFISFFIVIVPDSDGIPAAMRRQHFMGSFC